MLQKKVGKARANLSEPLDIVTKVEFVTVYEDAEGKRHERPFDDPRPVQAPDHGTDQEGSVRRIYLDGNL
jgi:hypothetical protein